MIRTTLKQLVEFTASPDAPVIKMPESVEQQLVFLFAQDCTQPIKRAFVQRLRRPHDLPAHPLFQFIEMEWDDKGSSVDFECPVTNIVRVKQVIRKAILTA